MMAVKMMGASNLMLRRGGCHNSASVAAAFNGNYTNNYCRMFVGGGRCATIMFLGRNLLYTITRKYSVSVAKESLLGIKQHKFSSVNSLLIKRYK